MRVPPNKEEDVLNTERRIMRMFLWALGLGLLVPSLALAAPVITCPELTAMDHVQALVSLVNLSHLGIGVAVFMGVIGMLILISRVIDITKIPAAVWETLGFAIAIALTTSALWVPQYLPQFTSSVWVMAIVGSLMAVGMTAVVINVHDLDVEPSVFFGIATVLFGGIAIAYQSTPIAFFAVITLLCAVGFTEIGKVFSFVFGFSEDKFAGATAMAIMLATFFLFLKSVGTSLPYIQIFETGALWAGTIFGAVGLVFISSKWYKDSSAGASFVRQVIAFAILGAGTMFGAIYQVDVVMWVAGIALAICFIERPYEWAPKSVIAYAMLTILIACTLGYGAFWLKDNVETANAMFAQLRT